MNSRLSASMDHDGSAVSYAEGTIVRRGVATAASHEREDTMAAGTKRAIVLVDLDYVWSEFNRKGEKFDPFALMDLVRSSGYTISLAQSYCDYQQVRFGENFQRDQTSAGLRQIQCPLVHVGGGNRKSTVDPEIIDDISWAVRCLEFDSLVLIAGDRDFMKAAQSVKNTGREFCLVRVGDGVSGDLSRAADAFIDVPMGLNGEVVVEEPLAPVDGEVSASITDDEIRKLQEHFAHREGFAPQPVAKAALDRVDPIPLSDIGRVFTLEQDEIDGYLDGCQEEVRAYLLTVFPRVKRIIEGESRLGRPAALKHIVNMLAGDPWSDPIPLGDLVMDREDLFHLVKLAASYGVLVRHDGFVGITSYKVSTDHAFLRWLEETWPGK